MKLALFGGTFDPVHLGHIALAERAAAEAQLDRVVFIPCRQSPHKSSSAAAGAQQRCEMIRLATAEIDWAEISTIELDRDGPSYSWQTAKAFAERFPNDELFWILGEDQWNVLETWAKPNILASLLTFLVFPRGRGNLQPKPGFRSLQLQEFDHPASATAVRNSREAAEEFLHPAVFEYATRHKIYDFR